MTEGPGLRERKNARTRDAIERAAAELALEQGYDHTTVDQIAERADVAPRTIYVRYPTKEAIFFSESADRASFHEWVDGTDDDLVVRLGRFIQSRVAASQENAELRRLKMRAVWTDPYLRRTLRGKLEDAEQLICASLSAELGLPEDDSGVRVFAGAITSLFTTMGEKAVAHPDNFDPLRDCARGLLFLRAGLDALKSDAALGDRSSGKLRVENRGRSRQ